MMRWAALILVAGCGDNGAIAVGSGVECGANTVLQGTTCVSTLGPCGAGTHDEGGTCRPDARYTIRAPAAIRADGWSQTEVRVLASPPTHDAVVIAVDRASAGALVSPVFVLDDLGGASNFAPCNSVAADCLGPARLTVALASAPADPVATVDVELVAPPAVGSATPCLGGGNVLFFDAHGLQFDGMVTFSTGVAFNAFGSPNRGVVQAAAPDVNWQLEFTSKQLGIPLIPSVYDDAVRADTAKPGQFGFTPTGNGPITTPCDVVNDVQIEAFAVDTFGVVTLLTATFHEQCVQDTTRELTGCVHYAQ